ncbi:hypothetical protein, partial [Nitratireductor arenosus]|uniref:hypothetical protein n=1 Tax=Nitratireductor arenosus TaxID=2682096 RepID=UPI001AEF071E
SCSFNTAMICSSVNRERFIRPSPAIDGLYLHLEEFAGLTSGMIPSQSAFSQKEVDLGNSEPRAGKKSALSMC